MEEQPFLLLSLINGSEIMEKKTVFLVYGYLEKLPKYSVSKRRAPTLNVRKARFRSPKDIYFLTLTDVDHDEKIFATHWGKWIFNAGVGSISSFLRHV